MRRRILLIICLLFISLNIFLIIKDNDNKIKRTTYIPKWTEVSERDMYDILEKDGVIDYMNQEFIYFNEQDGLFNEFLINEGDIVKAGDPLYSYRVEHYDETKLRLDNEVIRLNNNIKSVENALKQIKQYSIDEKTFDLSTQGSDETVLFYQNNTNAILQKEQYTIEKEKELDQLKAQLDSVESQLKDLTSTNGIVNVESPFSGKVTDINTSITNPLITIESEQLHVVSELNEQERMDVELDMPVNIQLVEDENADSIDGIVTYISDDPEDVSVKNKSIYPLHVTFNENNELEHLLRGYHVNLKITLAESLKTTAIKTDVIDNKSIWKMDHSGRLIKERAEKGLEVGHYTELVEGVQLDDRIAINSRNNLIDGATYITPLKPSRSTWKTMFKDGSRKRSILIGLLAR